MTGLYYAFEVEGISSFRAVNCLLREGIPIVSAKKTAKNSLKIVVSANERKKTFAILQGSCYNIKKSHPLGLMRAAESARRAVGLLIGAVLALACVLFVQSRVLKIEVTGSGAYLEPQIRAVLSGQGVGYFSAMPQPNEVIPEILSLPRVHFCSVKGKGGILTVNVEVGDERETLRAEPLLSPAAGQVEELVVLRGTPLVSVGDSVEFGQELVGAYALHGEKKEDCIVVALVKVAFPVSREYMLDEEGARLQALLDFGEISEIHTTKTAQGWLVEGTGHAEASKNFG